MSEVIVKNKEPIYVIGFPKSGNTWLARLLAELTRSKIEATNPVDAADNSPDRDGPYVIHKAHLVKDAEHVLQNNVVYIVRDIRDVLVSAFFFNNRCVREDWVKSTAKPGVLRRLLFWPYFRHQISRMNKHWQGNELSVILNWIRGNKDKLGSWSEHVSYWSHQPGVIVVRYEDLLADTEREMRRVLSELDIEVSNEWLNTTISNQDFKKKKSEFIQSGDVHNVKFLRRGKTGGWKNFLNPCMLKKIEMRHARIMREYRYKCEHYSGQ